MDQMNKKIEEALENHFPKGHSARGEALVLHAIAQIELKKAVQAEREGCAIKYASRERLPVSQCQRVLDTEIQQHYFKPQINDRDFCELCNDNFRSEAHIRAIREEK